MKKKLKYSYFIQKIEKEVKKEIDEAVEKSKSDPFPNEVSLYTDVYCDNQNHYIRGVELKDSRLPHPRKE